MVELVALNPNAARLVGPGRVVHADVATRLITLDTLHTEAEREAARLIDAAHGEAAAIREAARVEGHAAATEEIQDRLFEIAEASLSLIERSEQRIIELAMQIAHRILGALPEEETVRQVAARSLRLAAHSRFIRLRVAPGSLASVRERLDSILPSSLPASAVEIVGDARITDPGCILETDAGLIDATIDGQLAAIRRGLERSLAQRVQGKAEP